MALQWIDTHVHLNFPEYQADLSAVAQRWRQAGVVQLVHSCVTPGEFPQLQALAELFPHELFLAVGLHPLDVTELVDPQALAHQLLVLARDPRVVAIGETGLDLYKAANTEAQIAAFMAQIQVAQTQSLPLIIHCREAAEPTLKVLQQAGSVPAVMHCWTGTPEETAQFVELGCYISFSGVVTFKNAKAVQASLLEVPLDQLLIETDCPFLAPVPMRGKRNEPAFVAHVAQQVATLRSLTLEELAEITTTNARRLFKLPIVAGGFDAQ